MPEGRLAEGGTGREGGEWGLLKAGFTGRQAVGPLT